MGNKLASKVAYRSLLLRFGVIATLVASLVVVDRTAFSAYRQMPSSSLNLALTTD